jgi:hypothetical protein
MATWTEAKQFLYTNYKVVEDKGESVIAVVDIGPRAQLVIALNWKNYIFFTSPFAEVGKIPPGKALNSGSYFGATEYSGMYGLRHIALLDTLDGDDLVLAVEELAQSADSLERELLGVDEL